MLKRCAVFAVFAFIASSFLAPILAQQRAPQNESIRQEDLRADLFFLAGDSLRGRLTDTEENRAAADFIRSRFERMGLKAPAERLVLPAVQPDDRDARSAHAQRARGVEATGLTRQLRAGRSSIRTDSARPEAARGHRVRGFGISAPQLGYDDYSGDVKGKVVLARSRAGRARSEQPFDGVVTSESSTAWRKGARGAGEGRGRGALRRDVHNHPGAANFEARRATTGRTSRRAFSATRCADGRIASTFRSRRSRRDRGVAGRRRGKTLDDLAKSAETARGFTPLALPGDA
jgi:hypothetical protein